MTENHYNIAQWATMLTSLSLLVWSNCTTFMTLLCVLLLRCPDNADDLKLTEVWGEFHLLILSRVGVMLVAQDAIHSFDKNRPPVSACCTVSNVSFCTAMCDRTVFRFSCPCLPPARKSLLHWMCNLHHTHHDDEFLMMISSLWKRSPESSFACVRGWIIWSLFVCCGGIFVFTCYNWWTLPPGKFSPCCLPMWKATEYIHHYRSQEWPILGGDQTVCQLHHK